MRKILASSVCGEFHLRSHKQLAWPNEGLLRVGEWDGHYAGCNRYLTQVVPSLRRRDEGQSSRAS